MVLDYRPPRKEEIQYVSDLVHGRHRKDAVAIVAAVVVGSLFGLAIVASSIASGNENVDLVFIVACVVVCAAAVAVIVGLIMASVRTIVAVCRVWKPARAITGVAHVMAALRGRSTSRASLSHMRCSVLRTASSSGSSSPRRSSWMS